MFQLLLQISEIQRPKANHNSCCNQSQVLFAVTNIRNSKTESKSQHSLIDAVCPWCCYKYQKFKDRKQITTLVIHSLLLETLLQISEIQRPKANHNNLLHWIVYPVAVTNIRNSKTESKSQHAIALYYIAYRCYKYQKFKDRKQITTGSKKK